MDFDELAFDPEAVRAFMLEVAAGLHVALDEDADGTWLRRGIQDALVLEELLGGHRLQSGHRQPGVVSPLPSKPSDATAARTRAIASGRAREQSEDRPKADRSVASGTAPPARLSHDHGSRNTVLEPYPSASCQVNNFPRNEIRDLQRHRIRRLIRINGLVFPTPLSIDDSCGTRRHQRLSKVRLVLPGLQAGSCAAEGADAGTGRLTGYYPSSSGGWARLRPQSSVSLSHRFCWIRWATASWAWESVQPGGI